MTIALQYTNITVNDVDESIAFYRDALGLDVKNDVASGDYRWVTLGSDAQPGLGIVLSEPHAGRSQADGDAMQELLTKGVLPILVFAADDLDATFETVRASGAEVLQEPIDQGYARDCAFRDPSGNMVRISQAQPADPSGREVDLAQRLADGPHGAHPGVEPHDRPGAQLDRRQRRVDELDRRAPGEHDEDLVRLDVAHRAGRHLPHADSAPPLSSSSTKPVRRRARDDLVARGTGSCASGRVAASVATAGSEPAHESNPRPSASSVFSRMLRRPRLWSARSSDQRVALMPTAAAGSGGNGSGRLRTISSSVRSVALAGEQVEHDVAGEPRGGDAEPGESGRVGDAALAGGAEERAELRRGVDRAGPAMREPQCPRAAGTS